MTHVVLFFPISHRIVRHGMPLRDVLWESGMPPPWRARCAGEYGSGTGTIYGLNSRIHAVTRRFRGKHAHSGLAPGHSAKKMASPAAMTADARPRRESQLLLVIVALLPRQTSAGHCYQTTVPAYCCSSMHGGRSNLMHKPAALPNRA